MQRFGERWPKENAAVTYNRQGACAILQGHYREASFYLLAAVVCDPDFWEAFFNLGNAWARLGEDEAAVWAYEQAIRNCDEHAPLFLNLGILYCRQKRFAEALPYLEHSYRLQPDGPSVAIALGYAWYHLGDYGLSWHWYRQAYRLSPRDKRIRDSLVLVGEKILASGD